MPDIVKWVARIHNFNGLIALVCIQAFGTQLCSGSILVKNFGPELNGL